MYERPFERHGRDLGAIDEHTILRALRFYLQCVALHVHGIGDRSEFHGDVDADSGIGIDLYSALLVIAEAGLAGGDVLGVNVKGGKVIKPFGIGDCPALYVRRYCGGYDCHPWHHCAARVCHHPEIEPVMAAQAARVPRNTMRYASERHES